MYKGGFISISLSFGENQFLKIVIEDKHKRGTESSHSIREASSVEAFYALFFKYFFHAMYGVFILLYFLTGLHHECSADCIEWVEYHVDRLGYKVSDHESLPDWCVVGVFKHKFFSEVVQTKSESSAEKHTSESHTNTVITSPYSILLDYLGETIKEAFELSLSSRRHVCGESSSSKI